MFSNIGYFYDSKFNITFKELTMSEKTCQHCKYANYYPAPFWYPYLDPYCAKGHGLCKVNKTCQDFELMGRYCR